MTSQATEEFRRQCMISRRNCDALVLAYSPKQPLATNYYIPSANDIGIALGCALRKIFGARTGEIIDEYDLVRWQTIADLNKLEEKILKGTQEVFSIRGDETNDLDIHLTMTLNFDSEWFCKKGNLYKFRPSKRKQALSEFKEYWDEQEKARWKQIHRFMRQATREHFEISDDSA